MRIQNLKGPQETAPAPVVSQVASSADSATPLPVATTASVKLDVPDSADRPTVEIAYLKARIQHLELVLEMARSLMGSNHERLLRRLNEVPHEMVELSAKLRRFDPSAVR
jgi:hypothetical protein